MKETEIKKRYKNLCLHMDEKGRRLWCGNEAMVLGRGGISMVERATGKSFNTIKEGIKEIKGLKPVPKDRVRREGAGRKRKIDKDPALKTEIEK